MENLLTVAEAAEKLSVHEATVRKSITHGIGVGAFRIRLKASRIGDTYRVRPDDLEKFIQLSSRF